MHDLQKELGILLYEVELELNVLQMHKNIVLVSCKQLKYYVRM